MRFIDTNILLYSISTASDEAAKRQAADQLLQSRDNALSVQVLQEFYVQATRPTRTDPLPHDIAVGLIEAWCRFPVQDITLGVLGRALHIKQRFGLSYWDSAIVAAAGELGCTELASEDMGDGQLIDGVRIVNPFR